MACTYNVTNLIVIAFISLMITLNGKNTNMISAVNWRKKSFAGKKNVYWRTTELQNLMHLPLGVMPVHSEACLGHQVCGVHKPNRYTWWIFSKYPGMQLTSTQWAKLIACNCKNAQINVQYMHRSSGKVGVRWSVISDSSLRIHAMTKEINSNH